MTEPILMPFQDQPFNGDTFAQAEFLKIKEQFSITDVIELGTCVGGTAKWFAENFDTVQTVEINEQFRLIALERVKQFENITCYLGNSVDLLPTMLSKVVSNCIIFIDSHWNDYFPLLDELKKIQLSGLKPVIVIHDCKVPDEPNLGYDSYKGVDISFETVHDYLDLIYGMNCYEHYYNSDATSTEIKRGLIYITPLPTIVEEEPELINQ